MHNFMIATGRTLGRPPPVIGYVIKLGELQTWGNIRLAHAVSQGVLLTFMPCPVMLLKAATSSRILGSSRPGSMPRMWVFYGKHTMFGPRALKERISIYMKNTGLLGLHKNIYTEEILHVFFKLETE